MSIVQWGSNQNVVFESLPEKWGPNEEKINRISVDFSCGLGIVGSDLY